MMASHVEHCSGWNSFACRGRVTLLACFASKVLSIHAWHVIVSITIMFKACLLDRPTQGMSVGPTDMACQTYCFTDVYSMLVPYPFTNVTCTRMCNFDQVL
jgi:hypothetical protein